MEKIALGRIAAIAEVLLHVNVSECAHAPTEVLRALFSFPFSLFNVLASFPKLYFVRHRRSIDSLCRIEIEVTG